MLPHSDVYTRLMPSKIHGIGVFAISDIPNNTQLFKHDNTSLVWIDESLFKNIHPNLKKMYIDFCVTKDNKLYGCPPNFNQLTMAWYLNHSDKPNVSCNENYDFYTIRDIKQGKELLVNYDTYSLKSF